ncbi:hypothetical protein [Gloeothece verrucosa]|uniref:Uncharacterized protein n=1 Tax=Gloeothece verrucosa (strain PCC 7822) TaxID=497965 RepID=E0U9Q3_GLOV7|nr:hypothetical protein [Gloeothece verrucosa]ADN13854.1 conserved hypothetical protein [Gloeothece verrucosa PCC 7822]
MVISVDDQVRDLFSQAAICVKELKIIISINPTLEEENAIAWLEESPLTEINQNLGTF